MFPLALPMVESLVIRVQVRGHLLRELSLPITTHAKECPVLATVTFLGFTFFMPLHHLTLILWTYFIVSFHKGL